MPSTVKIMRRADFGDRILYQAEMPDNLAHLDAGQQLGWVVQEAIRSDVSLARADLTGVNLRRLDLRGGEFDFALLNEADLSGADLRGVRLSNAVLIDVNLREANLRQASLFRSTFRRVNLQRANLSSSYGRESQFHETDLTAVNMNGADLREVQFFHSNLNQTDLMNVNLQKSVIQTTSLKEANIRNADLRWTSIYDADLSGSDLHGTNFRDAVMVGVNFTEANLIHARLNRVRLQNFDLGADVKVPTLPNIDIRMDEIIQVKDRRLDFDNRQYDFLDTNCRANWAIYLCGTEGYELEKQLGRVIAGTLIYAASRPDQPVPDFKASIQDSLADIKACAAAAKAQKSTAAFPTMR